MKKIRLSVDNTTHNFKQIKPNLIVSPEERFSIVFKRFQLFYIRVNELKKEQYIIVSYETLVGHKYIIIYDEKIKYWYEDGVAKIELSEDDKMLVTKNIIRGFNFLYSPITIDISKQYRP